MVNPDLDATRALPGEAGCGWPGAGPESGGESQWQKRRGQGGSRCSGGGPGRSCVCMWWRLTHKARGRGNEEAGVATPLEPVRSNAGGKGCGRLGHICG